MIEQIHFKTDMGWEQSQISEQKRTCIKISISIIKTNKCKCAAWVWQPLIFHGINHYNPSGKQVAPGTSNNIMKLSFFRLRRGCWRKSKLNHAARELCYYVIKQRRAGPRARHFLLCQEGVRQLTIFTIELLFNLT